MKWPTIWRRGIAKAPLRERLAEAFGQMALWDTDNAERLRDRAAQARNKAKEIGK